MNNTKERSSIKLNSNIMLKSKFEKDPRGYLPPDLLPEYYKDSRVQGSMTPRQQKQFEKLMFYANRVVDE